MERLQRYKALVFTLFEKTLKGFRILQENVYHMDEWMTSSRVQSLSSKHLLVAPYNRTCSQFTAGLRFVLRLCGGISYSNVFTSTVLQ